MSTEAISTEHSRDIPLAPPLPVPKGFQGVRNAAYRMIGLPSRPPSPKLARIDLHLPTFDRFASLGVGQNATTSHRTGLELNTLSINDQGTHALIGGKEIFKTVRVKDGICVEDRNLRTAIRSTPTQASGHVRQVYSIDIADVAWAKGDCGDYVAAATTSGKIILYDLGHAALQAALLHEHYRQVHKVTFNPHRGSFLLSGSQDGTVRLWDVRDLRAHASTLQSKRKFSGQSDGVRDVKWSPTEGVDFAFGTDSGWIQRWDIRNLKVPKIRIPAHQSSCTSLDWHPDGKHLLSAGIDKVMRIWDFTGSRVHTPSWEVRTPYPISNARWRPACESSFSVDNAVRLCTQIVAAYKEHHPEVHIWDLRRPALPFRVLTPYATAPTDMLWHSQDLLWTVGREGIFQQTDVQHTTKLIDQRNLQSMAVAADGSSTFALQQRYQEPTPRHHSLPKLQTPVVSLGHSPDSIHLSRSWADDSLDHSFLSANSTRRPSQVKLISKAARMASTPHSGGTKSTVINLDDVFLNRQTFTPVQTVFTGLVPLQLHKDARQDLQDTYVKGLIDTGSTSSILGLLDRAVEQYAVAAQRVRQHQTAQTWRIVSFAMQRHLEKRSAKSFHGTKDNAKGQDFSHMIEDILDQVSSPRPSTMNSPSSIRPVHAIAQALAMTESTSNVPTPLARAVPHDKCSTQYRSETSLPDIETGVDLEPLPPSLTVQPRSNDIRQEHIAQSSKIEKSRPLSIQPMPSESAKASPRPPLVKHDSDESFVFMIGSQSSNGGTPSSMASAESPASMVKERPSRPLLKINSASPLPSELHAALKASVESESLLSPTVPIIFPPDENADLDQSISMQESKELFREVATQHEDILNLKASMKHDLEDDEPFTLVEMIQELVSHYTQAEPDAQISAQLLLTIVPLLPETHQLDTKTTKAYLHLYAESLLAEGYARDDVASVLVGALRHMILAGIHPLQLESVLSTHHDHLIALKQDVAAANLRKLAYPMFPSVYQYGLNQDDFTLACGHCKQRLSPDQDLLTCSACNTEQLACPICLCLDTPFHTTAGGSLRVVCLLCTHSTHVGCASEWFSSSHIRRCPAEGCLCSCPAKT